MTITASEILLLIGRLDDAPGFDTPRERFRRFLSERVTGIEALKAIIESAERSIGEQSHRLLQEALVALGRFLGFETTCGTYEPQHDSVRYDGQWRSRRRLHVVLEILTDQTIRADAGDLDRTIAALPSSSSLDPDARRLGISIVSPLFAVRGRFEEALTSRPDRRIVSTRSLVWLAEQVSAGRISHDEVVKILLASSALDLEVELLRRYASEPVGDGTVPTEPESVTETEPDFWAATVSRNESAGFERIVASAVGKRHVLGVGEDRMLPGIACAGDWVCFFLPEKGIVGHAQISAPADGKELLMRDTDRPNRVYRLTNIDLYDAPVTPDADAVQSLVAQHERTGRSSPLLIPVSRRKFEGLTKRVGSPLVPIIDSASH